MRRSFRIPDGLVQLLIFLWKMGFLPLFLISSNRNSLFTSNLIVFKMGLRPLVYFKCGIIYDFLSGKYCVWKLNKDFLFVIQYVILKQTPFILKYFLCNAAKTGYYYIFACKQNIFHRVKEWILYIYHKYWTIFIEFQKKNTSQTHFYCLFFMYISFGNEKN